jgi:hypothetical protein
MRRCERQYRQTRRSHLTAGPRPDPNLDVAAALARATKVCLERDALTFEAAPQFVNVALDGRDLRVPTPDNDLRAPHRQVAVPHCSQLREGVGSRHDDGPRSAAGFWDRGNSAATPLRQ